MHIEVSTDNSIDGSEALTSIVSNLVQHELANMEKHDDQSRDPSG